MNNMVVKLIVVLLSIFISFPRRASQGKIIDVTKYGAVGIGKTDISVVLLKAWKYACAASAPVTVLILAGTYVLNEVTLQGPCKSPTGLTIDGILKAYADLPLFKSRAWITFEQVAKLTILGKRVLDGNGATAWKKNDCKKNSNCKALLRNLRLKGFTDSLLKGIKSKDSMHFYINLLGCKNVVLDNITLIAPDESPNTDGIHVGRSTGINITNSVIGAGDDCVSIGDEITKVLVEGVTCGPGHGINIGSLGKWPNEKPVSGIMVRKFKLSGIPNCAQIKTWQPAASPNTASDIHFEDITMTNVSNPIIIDQEYCPYNKCNQKTLSTVKISGVSFRKITGTSATVVVVSLIYSSSHSCTNVQISDIDLKYSGGLAKSVCKNIQPTLSGKLNPHVCSIAPKGDETQS